MRTFLTGIISLGLIILPVIFMVWMSHTHPSDAAISQTLGPFVISWLIGFIVASGLIIKEDGSTALSYFGKTLCVVAVLIQVICILVF